MPAEPGQIYLVQHFSNIVNSAIRATFSFLASLQFTAVAVTLVARICDNIWMTAACALNNLLGLSSFEFLIHL
jgi:hypothetical protein